MRNHVPTVPGSALLRNSIASPVADHRCRPRLYFFLFPAVRSCHPANSSRARNAPVHSRVRWNCGRESTNSWVRTGTIPSLHSCSSALRSPPTAWQRLSWNASMTRYAVIRASRICCGVRDCRNDSPFGCEARLLCALCFWRVSCTLSELRKLKGARRGTSHDHGMHAPAGGRRCDT